MGQWKELVETADQILDEVDPGNVKAFYRKLIAFEKTSEFYFIREQYAEFKSKFGGEGAEFEKNHPEFVKLIARNNKKIKAYKQKEKKMYANILNFDDGEDKEDKE